MLIELWRNTTVREGFEHGRSLNEISEETGLSLEEVLQREVELHLFSVARDTPGNGDGLSRKEPRALG
jgi:hypothetical protein